MMNCVIVEDEPVARNIIRTYCNQLPYLRVIQEFGNALDAREFLANNNVQLVFLDIRMPGLNGISFLATLKNPPQVIFTTAYQEYAVDAFGLAACDYLLKPFSLERFVVAVDRARERMTVGKEINGPKDDTLFIRADGKIYNVLCKDCLYGEAQGNYTKIVTRERTILTKMPFTAFMDLLPAGIFCRVHRSFVINIKSISYIEGNRVYIQQVGIPMTGNYKDELLKKIGLQ